MLIEKAFDRYGQESLWNKIDQVVIKIHSIGGMIPRLKGIGSSFPHFGSAQIFPHQNRVIFFDRNNRELGSFESGTITLKNENPLVSYRAKFSGVAKYRRWNLADAIYFFGYAITTYTGVPFILKNLIESESAWGKGFRVKARFAKNFDTHGRCQSFYFDKSGLLVRHDYHAEILGWFAYGAHFTSDFKEIRGFPIARKRQVYARIGAMVTPIPILQASIEPIDVVLK